MAYLTREHPDAFLDFPQEIPIHPLKEGHVICPICSGHGGWNLRINAYKLPKGETNTPENRHKWVHFQCTCRQCNGWGFVKPEDAHHEHVWDFHRNLGNCYNQYKCNICGKLENVDSSD